MCKDKKCELCNIEDYTTIYEDVDNILKVCKICRKILEGDKVDVS